MMNINPKPRKTSNDAKFLKAFFALLLLGALSQYCLILPCIHLTPISCLTCFELMR